MSRSGYSDDCENVDLWRNAVGRAIGGRRGQAFLKELLADLDAMPVKRLITEELQAEGSFCTIGTVGAARGINMTRIDPYDYDQLADIFGIARSLVQEIEWMNDEGTHRPETPEERWVRMRAWVASQIRESSNVPAPPTAGEG